MSTLRAQFPQYRRRESAIYKMENRNSAAAAAMTVAVGVGVALYHSWQARAH